MLAAQEDHCRALVSWWSTCGRPCSKGGICHACGCPVLPSHKGHVGGWPCTGAAVAAPAADEAPVGAIEACA